MSDDSSLNEIQRLISEIKTLRDQAEQHAKAAETARKNADSEGLFAINAKKACEEHSTAISQLKGLAESESQTVTANKQKTDELLAAVNAAKAAFEAATNAALADKQEVQRLVGEVKKAAQVGATSLHSIEIATKAAQGSQSSGDKARIAAELASTEVQATLELIRKSLVTADELRKTAGIKIEEISKLLADAAADKAELRDILDHISRSDAISVQHEAKVTELESELVALMKRVDSILPGATSASLASSFNSQKDRFNKPQKRWYLTFMVCIGLLVLTAVPSFIVAIWGKSTTLDDLLHGLLLRLPIIVPLVWLAIYAGRNYMLSLRLEEEYAYKEAVSRAFEGYKREMERIQACDADRPAPINKLCENILAAIAERPGRIYEGKPQDITILTETRSATDDVMNIAKKQIAKG